MYCHVNPWFCSKNLWLFLSRISNNCYCSMAYHEPAVSILDCFTWLSFCLGLLVLCECLFDFIKWLLFTVYMLLQELICAYQLARSKYLYMGKKKEIGLLPCKAKPLSHYVSILQRQWKYINSIWGLHKFNDLCFRKHREYTILWKMW